MFGWRPRFVCGYCPALPIPAAPTGRRGAGRSGNRARRCAGDVYSGIYPAFTVQATEELFGLVVYDLLQPPERSTAPTPETWRFPETFSRPLSTRTGHRRAGNTAARHDVDPSGIGAAGENAEALRIAARYRADRYLGHSFPIGNQPGYGTRTLDARTEETARDL